MKNHDWMRRGRMLAMVAGSMDTLTGCGLVTLPAFTLHAMLAPVPGPEALVYVRFLGSFVAAVGLSYLTGLLWAGGRWLRPIFGVTLIFRLAAGSFTGVAVLQGALGPAWLTVALTDLTLAALQGYLLLSRNDAHE